LASPVFPASELSALLSREDGFFFIKKVDISPVKSPLSQA
jgi:hypothetical protein